jgi:membrane associated rhomboid family serine protease
MKTSYRKYTQPLIPNYQENGALQLIVASGSTFIMFHFVRICMLIMGVEKTEVFQRMFPNFGLSTITAFSHKPWTIFTYGWLHHGFFDWFTNMIWLYCFASVLQNLTSYKQVIPLFVYSILVGGACYIGVQYLPGAGFHPSEGFFMGAQAGVIALGVAALTIAPTYRLHFTPSFSIPLALVVGIYIVLDLLVYISDQLNVLALCAGGIATGFIYAMLLKQRLKPGEWVYDLLGSMERMTVPDTTDTEKKGRKRMEILRGMYEPKKGISQHRIDEILDKINEKGYHSLTREEKEILLTASKD